MNRTYTSQVIQFKGTKGLRRPNEKQVMLMQTHGFQFNTSEKVGDHWVIEYSRVVTRFETVSKKFLETLGKNFTKIDPKESIMFAPKYKGDSASL
jgi:hypothetical protein